MRRLIKNHGTLFIYKRIEFGLSTLFHRQKALETKAMGWQTGIHEGRYESSSAGQAFHLDTHLYALMYKQITGVGNRRGTGITHKGNSLSGKNFTSIRFGCFMLVEFMKSR